MIKVTNCSESGYFVDLITTQFSDNYTLHQPVTIDEAMIPYKGRLAFKPTKWSIKVFVLSDATNGYTYRLQKYTGKNLESTVDVELSSKVLLELMTGLDRHHLYTDNYYTGPEVYLQLYKKKKTAAGLYAQTRLS